MAILRSTHAHALIKGIDASVAEKMPGVVKVITGADLVAAKVMPLPCVWIPGSGESHFPSHPDGHARRRQRAGDRQGALCR